MPAVEQSRQARLGGRVVLRFAGSRDGTRLERRYRSGHFHLAKPYWDGRQLVTQVVNSTAGVFENDTLDAGFSCGSGARACILFPSSTQVYTMPGGEWAESRQSVRVDSGGALAVLPRWLVPHRRSRFRQATTIDVGSGGSLFLLEPVAAGRLGFGEFLEMDELSSRLEIRIGGRLALREHLHLGRQLNRWILEHGNTRFPYLASAYIIFPGAADFLTRLLESGPSWLGHQPRTGLTILTDELAVLRLVGESCTEITTTLELLYALLEDRLPLSPVRRRF